MAALESNSTSRSYGKTLVSTLDHTSHVTLNKPTIKKQMLYTSFPTLDRPQELVSMDYISRLPLTKHGNDYVFLVVDQFF